MKRWLLPLLLLTACSRPEDEGPIRVSVIGGPPTLVDPNLTAPDTTQRVLLGAVAETIVTYDERGQIGPALAQRWIVTSDGLSAIFRLRPATWSNGKEVTSAEVARRARAMLAASSRNPLRDAFDSVEEINPTTPDVIEFRLTTPRPPLLELLAQPEASMITRAMLTSGPFEIAKRTDNTVILEPRDTGTGDDLSGPDPVISLTGERAAMAITRFTEGRTDLVLGGTYLDWPMIQIAEPQTRAVRIDPAEGLFGLSFHQTEGFLADPLNRQAMAMAIDRDALLTVFAAPGWRGVLTVLPQRYRSAADPAYPPWAVFDIAGRIQQARRRVQAWQSTQEEPLLIRLFLPEGPGSNLLFGRLAADWLSIGIQTVRSNARAADLHLVDLVAPAGSALWYLNSLACPTGDACSEETVQALDRARDAQSLVERGTQLALADRLLADSGLYVPLARPLRWSLVSPRLDLFQQNARAYHPLTHLRERR